MGLVRFPNCESIALPIPLMRLSIGLRRITSLSLSFTASSVIRLAIPYELTFRCCVNVINEIRPDCLGTVIRNLLRIRSAESRSQMIVQCSQDQKGISKGWITNERIYRSCRKLYVSIVANCSDDSYHATASELDAIARRTCGFIRRDRCCDSSWGICSFH